MITPWYRRGVMRRLRGSKDEGVALVTVVGSMLVLAALASAALAYSIAGERFARYDQDYAAAMSAAQSGVDDFISRLNRDDDYGETVDCANTAWKGPLPPTSNSCGWGSTTPVGWMPVQPGNSDPKGAYFHYTVDASQKSTTGTVVLDVTGKVNGVYRTVETSVTKGGSTDYVYYTDFEDADPANVQAYPSGPPNNSCGLGGYSNAEYWYEGRSNCQEITFIGDDTLDGSVFTNDTILSDGAHFLKGVQTATPNCANAGSTTNSWNTACLRSGSTADFNGIKPRYADPLYLPDNSAEFKDNPGCHYYGSTRVVFSSDGTMTVWNKRSVNGSNPALADNDPAQVGAPLAIAPPGGAVPSCGTLAQLDSVAGAKVAVPNNMVIYTFAAPSTSTANRQCYGGELGGPTSRTLPLGTYSSSTSVGQQATYDVNMTEAFKKCSEGNLYVEGVVKGRVTAAAAQSVIVTGDIVLAGGLNGTDLVGLVATNSVEVMHARMVTGTRKSNGSWGSQSSESEPSGTWPYRYKEPGATHYEPTDGIQISASIQTLQHSFLVQKYSVGGDKGTLLVNGSIAQRWRGIVGCTGNSSSCNGHNGYAKLYKYDTRLTYTRPPYFPLWVNSEWSARYTGEIRTAPEIKS